MTFIDRPTVSVVIPTYNRALFVNKAIDSVLNQTFTDYEIIVVDDGSTDATKEILKKYDERILYIYQDNSGVSAARNTGIKLANGEWLAFLDSDDEWNVNYLAKQMNQARKVSGLCMQTTNSLFIALNGETRSYFEINRSLSAFDGRDYLLLEEPFRFVVKHGPWQIGSTIVLRDAIMRAGLFDTSLTLSEDLDLMARVALHGRFGLIREELVRIYRRDEETECLTTQVKRNPIQAREGDERIFEHLKRIRTLQHKDHKDHKALNELLSANRRAIGNLLLKTGDVKGARTSFRDAVVFNPSIASLGKYILSFLPIGTSLWLSQKYLAWRARRKIGAERFRSSRTV